MISVEINGEEKPELWWYVSAFGKITNFEWNSGRSEIVSFRPSYAKTDYFQYQIEPDYYDVILQTSEEDRVLSLAEHLEQISKYKKRKAEEKLDDWLYQNSPLHFNNGVLYAGPNNPIKKPVFSYNTFFLETGSIRLDFSNWMDKAYQFKVNEEIHTLNLPHKHIPDLTPVKVTAECDDNDDYNDDDWDYYDI